MENRIRNLFNIQVPIIQAGMVWCSGWKLASAVSNAGGLGLIGAGSMNAELLREHIKKCKQSTSLPFGVNVPLLYPEVENQINVILEEKVKIVFTSAGNPAKWTSILKSEGIVVTHVVSSTRFAAKSEDAGVDAVVAEGFEAGGHNGRDETTTICLVPAVRNAVDLPVIAAGGIGSGKAMLAAFCLGAEGVQVGSRFAASVESSAHENFKRKIVESVEGDTILSLKKLTPVRMIKNRFYEQVKNAEDSGADTHALVRLLGKGRSRKGIFEGDLDNGELEIGQVSSLINSIKPAAAILSEIWNDFKTQKALICNINQISDK